VSKGCSVLAKSVTPSRITENLHPAVLDKGDMKMLDRISETKPKRYLLPDFAETYFGWTATN
jgi:diketogulonate reductase-like aldo/keto reductase